MLYFTCNHGLTLTGESILYYLDMAGFGVVFTVFLLM